jgi:hypothetical protein
MRVHAVSASAAVTRTLEAIIAASGHSIAPAAEAELLLVDTLHPAPLPASDAPQFTLGNAPACGARIPVRPAQLARVLAAYRGAAQITLGTGWSLDVAARSLTHASAPALSLTEKETALLATLAAAHPALLTREVLLESVWGMRAEIDTHTLETHIYRLRQKLESAPAPAPCDIATEGGSYRLTGV